MVQFSLQTVDPLKLIILRSITIDDFYFLSCFVAEKITIFVSLHKPWQKTGEIYELTSPLVDDMT